MKTREEYIKTLREHKDELKSKFGIKSLYLFGSVSRNEQHDGSDVDVFVEMEPKLFLLSGLKQFLEKLTDNNVDVIRKHSHMNPLLLEEINRDGVHVI